MDMSPYRNLFVSEARNHLNAFNELILQLEDNASDRGAIDEMFRHAHSLKGMAATMQFDAVSTLAHRMEDLLGRVRSNEFPFCSALADLLLEGSDLLSGMVSVIERGEGQQPEKSELIERLASFSPGNRQNAGTLAEEHPQSRYQPRQSDSFKSVRVRTETLDRLVNITGELITTRHRLTAHARHSAGQELEEPLHQLSTLLRELRDEVFKARMLPFSFAAEHFPRLVRDLARKQGKVVSLQIEGREIELDRGILEEISEALVHILRNAVDHGLECPDARVAAGKPGSGVISLTVVRDRDHVDISVADDGRGMDPDQLRLTAVEKGMLTAAQARKLSRQEALMLACAPGLSTSAEVTDISGRGVGMDAVKAVVHLLGGTLAIESAIGRGTRFTLRLPLTVSIIHALLVECGVLTLAFPANAVTRTIELRRSDVLKEAGRTFFVLDGRRIPLKSLNRLLHQPPPRLAGSKIQVVVSETGGVAVGLATDRFLGHEEIFVKPVGIPLSRMKGISGGTVTGDGRIVFIMDAGSLA
jgi:two-component system chemotaxis sensor kinase CheA